ncbi:formate/nitrite transporter family protein [Halosquirtibacter laminarini]|uniref:Formate/nitrite transporter family protein n=1 Tax=Halosquirtibacter laminarini TaxID=3374600 RepID=A0AC61NMJ7_9BACT|nr:formate/nitrite transporter family protein [Prolixibacteraceae bacterium]
MGDILSPEEIVGVVRTTAKKKADYSIKKILILSFLAGAYISFGSLFAIIVAGGTPGLNDDYVGLQKLLLGATFPVGLIMVVIAGAELFTGNTAYFMPNVIDGVQGVRPMFRNWFWVYLGNFIGAIFVAYFLTYLTEVVAHKPWLDMVHKIAIGKTSNPFYKTFLKGIGANWLVCLAMWLGMASKSATGKILGIWWPVMAFVTIGFEHSIANMYFIPLSIFHGSSITWSDFIVHNLIPATLGNIVGGLLFVGTLYGVVFAKK